MENESGEDLTGASSLFGASLDSLKPPEGTTATTPAPRKRSRGTGRPRGRPRRDGTARPVESTPKAPVQRHGKTRDEMAARIASLEAQLHTATGGVIPETVPTVNLDELAAALGTSFVMLGGVLARMSGGPEMQISTEEATPLGHAWAPVVAPLLKDHANKLPVIMAIGVSGQILLPKIEATIARKRAEKKAKSDDPTAREEITPRGAA